MDLVNRVFCIEKQCADWVKWQLRLPLVISGILGTVSLYLVRVDSPFVRTMGGFELALFSGMLLLGVAMYLRDVQLSRPAATHDKKLNDALDQALWSGVVVLIFYSMFRADVASGALFEEEAVSPRGWIYVILNATVLLAATAFSQHAFLTGVELEKKLEEANAVSGEAEVD